MNPSSFQTTAPSSMPSAPAASFSSHAHRASQGPSRGDFAARMESRSAEDPPANQQSARPRRRQERSDKSDNPKKSGEKRRRLMARFDDPLNAIERQMMALMPPPGSRPAGGAAAGLNGSIQPKGISMASLQQIVDRVQVGATEKGGSMFQVELKGDVLDGLKVQVSMEKGKVHVSFLSENPEIRKLLDENTRCLERSMRERGLTLGSLETRDPKEQQRDQQRQQHQRDREQAAYG